MAQFVFEAIGTQWVIDVYRSAESTSHFSDSEKWLVLERIKKTIEDFEKTFSRFREDSIVAYITQGAGEYIFPEYAKEIFAVYKNLYDATNGFFTPLIGGALVDAGYDRDYSLVQKEIARIPTWSEVMEYVHPVLTTKIPARLDFGAAGKGYLIDLVARVLEQHALQSYTIDAGGDMYYKGAQVLSVGLESPIDASQVLGVYNLTSGKSIAGSAGNRRTWGDFTHIINPKTGTSPRETVAVWVVANSALIADALTTCLFFVAPDTLAGIYDFEYLIVYKDFSIQKSEHFDAALF
jgi:thiamine biosynthesis lipoprotein